MRRVVVTGMGIVSSIGNNAAGSRRVAARSAVGHRRGRGLSRHGLSLPGAWQPEDRSRCDGGPARAPLHGRRRRLLLGGDGSGASRDAGLEEKDISNPTHRPDRRLGRALHAKRIVAAADTARNPQVPKRVGPFAVPKAMSSTCSANLSTWFKTKGVNYSISSACSTTANCIGNAAEMIQWGKQDMMFAGGGEELDWTLSELFDAMGAMSSKYNATPEKASRAYRQEPRRLRDLGRRRHSGAGRTRACQGARRENLCRTGRLWRDRRTAPTWWRRRAKARCAACAWRSTP